jgi:FtsH-binding integral membrane protein
MNISSSLMNAISSNQWSNFARAFNSSITSWSGVILGTSALALTGLGVYRWSQSGVKEEEEQDFGEVKERVSRAYAYVFGGFALTASAAVVCHVSGVSRAILQNAYLTIPIVLTSCASLAATILIDKENTKAKHVAWGIFNFTMGMSLAPLGYLNQKIVAQAAAISLGLGGALTLTAFLAPDRRFLAWEGPLMAALTNISIASFVACFFPGSAFAYGVDRASLYGGLVIFSGLFMSSTQRLMEEAEKQSDKDFDPINSSLNIYLDGLNIFVRILRILLENNKEENA